MCVSLAYITEDTSAQSLLNYLVDDAPDLVVPVVGGGCNRDLFAGGGASLRPPSITYE